MESKKVKNNNKHLTLLEKKNVKGNFLSLEPVIPHLILMVNKISTCCKHFFGSVIRLLQSHPMFYKYYNQISGQVKHYISFWGKLMFKFAPCDGCGLPCHNCRKEGSLWCEKCVCIGCKRSQNVTLMAPVFNRHCWKCATQKWIVFDKFRYPIMSTKTEIINYAKNLNNMWLSVIQSIVSVMSNKKITCLCNIKTVALLLQTCKKFIVYLPLVNEICKKCRPASFDGRRCDSCYVCRSCKYGELSRGISCYNCRDLCVLKCKKCTCSYCGNSSNVTDLRPEYGSKVETFGIYDLNICIKCAKRKYGIANYMNYKYPVVNYDFIHYQDYGDSGNFDVLDYNRCSYSTNSKIELYFKKLTKNSEFNLLFGKSFDITYDEKPTNQQNSNKIIEKLIIKPRNQTPLTLSKGYNKQQNKNTNNKIRHNGQIQQRNSKK